LTRLWPESQCTKKALEKSAFGVTEKPSFLDSRRAYGNKSGFDYGL
jgi:hypothetical protein